MKLKIVWWSKGRFVAKAGERGGVVKNLCVQRLDETWRRQMKISSIGSVRAWVLGLAGMSCAFVAAANELRIGFKAEVTSADPHVLNGQNRNVWMHVYESLVGQDDKLRSVPQLATSWRNVGEKTWEFKLRPNVSFHNGTPLTAEDVKFSIERAMEKTGPRTFRSYLKSVASVQVADPLTVVVTTNEAAPTLPDNLGLIAIVPRSIGKDASEESFESGKSAIGTGPYRYDAWLRGQSVALAANEKYWAGVEPWSKVSFRFIPKEPARASALLAGSVDVIDGASASLAEAFQRNPGIGMVSATSYMLNYLAIDHFRPSSPYVTGNDGQPLAKNPLQDKRVRQALSLAIDRDAIGKFVMKGDAEASVQMVPAGFFGHDARLKPQANAAKAKSLLAEAGYPEGFKIALHCSNDRYLNDAKVCEAMGQMLTQVGIKTDVRTLPFAVFQTRGSTGGANGEPEFSLSMWGIGAVTGDSLEPLIATVSSYDKGRGTGANNRGRYSNKDLDALVTKATQSLDQKARDDTQKAAAQIVTDDVGIMPIHHLKASWALRKGLSMKPRSDGFTLATSIRETGAK